MWADFQVYIKDASFREKHFCHWNFRSISPHPWVILILVRKPLEYFLIRIHGPSSLFIWRLVDVSRFSVSNKSWALREEHFCHWNFRTISPHPWVILILVRKPLECFWFWSMVLLAYLLDDSLMWADFQVYIKDASFREKHFCHWNFRSISPHPWVILILVRKPMECFWFWSMVLLAYLLDDSLMWADFQVYIKDASFREKHFCHWNFRSISPHPWVILILVRKPLEYFLIMIHGPSSLFIWRLVEVSWFSSLYKRCVFSRGKFLSLKLSLYLLSFLSCIDSREKTYGVFLILIHGPSSLFIGRLVDVSWFSSLYKRCVFSRKHFCHWNFRSISPHPWVILILVRKPLEYFLIMIHGPSSLFIWRLVDVSWFSSLYKRCVFSRGTFMSLKLSLYLLSFLSCIDSRVKAYGVFLIMIHGPSNLFIWRLVDVSWFSSLYKRCVFSRETFLSLKLSLYLLSSLSYIDSREKAFGVFFDYDPWSF